MATPPKLLTTADLRAMWMLGCDVSAIRAAKKLGIRSIRVGARHLWSAADVETLMAKVR